MSLASIAVPHHNDEAVLVSSLARYLGFGAYPATAAGLTRRLGNQQAPAELTRAVSHLPADRQFRNLGEVCDALGLPRPSARRAVTTGRATPPS